MPAIRKIRPWTAAQKKELRGLAAKGYTSPRAAKKLRRTAGAVRQKARSLGIRFGRRARRIS